MHAHFAALSLARVAFVAVLTTVAGCAPVFDCSSYAGLQPVASHASTCALASARQSDAAR